MFDVVEGHHHVVQADRHGRHVEFVNRRQRHAFQLPAQVVAQQAGRAPRERRQSGHARRLIQGQLLFQLQCCIGPFGRDFQKGERIGREERITTELRVAAGAIQQQAMRPRGELEKHVFGFQARRKFFDQRQAADAAIC